MQNITKRFIEASVFMLRVVCQASEEDTARVVKMLYHEDICVSTVSNITRRYPFFSIPASFSSFFRRYPRA